MLIPQRRRNTFAVLAIGAAAACTPGSGEVIQEEMPTEAGRGIPVFEYDPNWPKDLPNDWLVGEIGGVFADSRGHVWVFQRSASTLSDRERGAALDPPLSICCHPAPSVIEFDAEGNVVQAWGGPETGAPDWYVREHGIYVDHNDFVWLTDHTYHIVGKFTRDGRHIFTLGEPEINGGSNDTAHFGEPTEAVVDPERNELYVADGYLNKRVIVFDAETGEYRRHWGAYGNRPNDTDLGEYDPSAPPAQQFRSPVHGVAISRDGLVYVADRRGDRIQVFERDGTFVDEAFVMPETRSTGSVYGVAFSHDAEQRFVYVPDGENNKVWILRRSDLEIVGSFGRSGREGGHFTSAHNLTVDPQGNVYVGETRGHRVQKFRFVGFTGE